VLDWDVERYAECITLMHIKSFVRTFFQKELISKLLLISRDNHEVSIGLAFSLENLFLYQICFIICF
jgi:hypothetical protein